MSKQTIPKEYNSIPELKNVISNLAKTNDFELRGQMIFAFGKYLQLISIENNQVPIFPIEFAPLPKEELKKWCMWYGIDLYKVKGKVLKYQEMGVLFYTKFQKMTTEEWSYVRDNSLGTVALYYNKGIEDLDNCKEIKVRDEYKRILNLSIIEHTYERDKFYNYLKTVKRKPSLLTIGVIILVITLLIWIFLK